MTADAVARALMRMDDDECRDAVAAGDFSTLADLDLADHEQDLLVGAADGDDAEVAGYSSFAPPFMPAGPDLGLMRAVRYAEDGLRTPALADEFRDWTAEKGAKGSG